MLLALLCAVLFPLELAEAKKPRCHGKKATLVGTGGDDRLRGGKGRDVIVGRGGDDRVDGRGKRDIVCGNSGDDDLIGGTGSDTVDGGAGDDRLRGHGGLLDQLYGGSGRIGSAAEAAPTCCSAAARRTRLPGGTWPDILDRGRGARTRSAAAPRPTSSTGGWRPT